MGIEWHAAMWCKNDERRLEDFIVVDEATGVLFCFSTSAGFSVFEQTAADALRRALSSTSWAVASPTQAFASVASAFNAECNGDIDDPFDAFDAFDATLLTVVAKDDNVAASWTGCGRLLQLRAGTLVGETTPHTVQRQMVEEQGARPEAIPEAYSLMMARSLSSRAPETALFPTAPGDVVVVLHDIFGRHVAASDVAKAVAGRSPEQAVCAVIEDVRCDHGDPFVKACAVGVVT